MATNINIIVKQKKQKVANFIPNFHLYLFNTKQSLHRIQKAQKNKLIVKGTPISFHFDKRINCLNNSIIVHTKDLIERIHHRKDKYSKLFSYFCTHYI
ncbi:hypothetical protein DW794_01520 [Bacteroides caccae]|uniref:Uncharacterized protein n=1 Tax=Bacteroides caccae TaxID=47678 RepID=A0A414FRE1_9BACE|nr:hypothetical protein [Bacteroides caccae]OKZ13666.1 MAG: hypothetical protein BHV72_18475 [Bacteroides sp. 43_46]RHA24044.1 hypothetical protein DW946_07800 [Bacteroides caccae]RHD53229.1 hypothetical protein DW794_01520 [Bacteroides caccae]RHH90292.1 hypothetical protein DW190_10525 [Bacteroides caccae]